MNGNTFSSGQCYKFYPKYYALAEMNLAGVQVRGRSGGSVSAFGVKIIY